MLYKIAALLFIANSHPIWGEVSKCRQTRQRYRIHNKAAIALQCKSNAAQHSCLVLYHIQWSYFRRVPKKVSDSSRRAVPYLGIHNASPKFISSIYVEWLITFAKYTINLTRWWWQLQPTSFKYSCLVGPRCYLYLTTVWFMEIEQLMGVGRRRSLRDGMNYLKAKCCTNLHSARCKMCVMKHCGIIEWGYIHHWTFLAMTESRW